MVDKKILLGVILLISICGAQESHRFPWEPTPVDDANWFAAHDSFVQNSLENGPNINVVFIGSSIIQLWGTTGVEIWNSTYAPLGAVNYGIGGDRTENVLWRVQNGELENMSPKLIVVFVGSNNVGTNSTIGEIIRGVTTVLQEIKKRLPTTRILYVELLPRGGGEDIEVRWQRIMAVNEVVRQLADGDKLTSFSLFWDFAEAWLKIKEELFESDLVHLNVEGYQQWDSSWNSTFNQLFSAQPFP